MTKTLKNLHVLVTGPRGFIGRPLVAHLRKNGAHVSAWTKDVRSSISHRGKLDAVIHLAAKTTNADFEKHPQESWAVNLEGTLHALELCTQKKARLVFISTSGVYGGRTGRVREDAPLRPVTTYAKSKAAGELLCRSFPDVPVFILRLFNVYGPGQQPPFLVPYLQDSLQRDTPILLKQPKAQRDFVHVDDVVRSMEAALTGPNKDAGIYNIGSGKSIAVLDVAKRLSRAMKKKLVWKKIEVDEPGVLKITADIKRARKSLGWSPRVTWDEGFRSLTR